MADSIEKRCDNVTYFPSYEIITSPAAQGLYYNDDLRQVRDIGVNHVMRVFGKHFLNNSTEDIQINSNKVNSEALFSNSTVVCDEELIEKSLNQ